jgi:hypothetical protein
MATTTTNFGWDIPQSTDLVKDGATAIAALGQDIDTALVDLKGGTTGQILAKASATDLDYSWTTPNPGDITGVTAGTGLSGGGTSGTVTVSLDGAAVIAPTIIDAKGDLITGTAADTPAILGVGTNGQILTADSTTPSGLKWATAATTTTIVKQITFGTLKATASTSSTSFTDTGLSASITPTSASSKIMVTANVSLAPMASGGIFLTLTDGSNTILLDPTSSGSRSKAFSRIEGDTAGQYAMFAQTLQFIDSPGSTSAKTYKIRWFVSGNTGYINRMTTDSDSDGYAAGISTITLTEYAV